MDAIKNWTENMRREEKPGSLARSTLHKTLTVYPKQAIITAQGPRNPSKHEN